jgi:MFS family permease
MERLHLMLVPRLGVVLTVVAALAVIGGAMAGPHWRVDARGLVLPLAVAALLVERFSVCRDEEGPGLAWRLLGGTLLVAAAILGLLHWPWLGRVMPAMPELELLVLAGLLLLGRYAGYRLSELIRFRGLTRGDDAGGGGK